MAEACSSAARDDALRANTVVGLTAAFAKAEQAVHLTQAAVGNHHIGDIAKAVEQLSAARGIYANIHVTSTVDPQFHAFVHEGMKSVEILLNRYQPLS